MHMFEHGPTPVPFTQHSANTPPPPTHTHKKKNYTFYIWVSWVELIRLNIVSNNLTFFQTEHKKAIENIVGKEKILVTAFPPFPTACLLAFRGQIHFNDWWQHSNTNNFICGKKTLCLSQTANFRLFETERPLQTTILYFMKMAGTYPKR